MNARTIQGDLSSGLRDHDAEFREELTRLVERFGAHLSTGEMDDACADVLEAVDCGAGHEHPASVALYDLGEQCLADAAKLRAAGETSAANVMASFPEDLRIIRAMVQTPRVGGVQAPAVPNVLDQFEALKRSLEVTCPKCRKSVPDPGGILAEFLGNWGTCDACYERSLDDESRFAETEADRD